MAEPTRYCEQCGSLLGQDVRFCDQCGAATRGGETRGASTSLPVADRNPPSGLGRPRVTAPRRITNQVDTKWLLWIGGAVVAVLVIAVVYALWTGPLSGSTREDSPPFMELKTFDVSPSDSSEIRELKLASNAAVEAFRRYQAAPENQKAEARRAFQAAQARHQEILKRTSQPIIAELERRR